MHATAHAFHFTQTVVESQTCKNHRKCLLQPSDTGADFSASYLESESVTAVKCYVDGVIGSSMVAMTMLMLLMMTKINCYNFMVWRHYVPEYPKNLTLVQRL